MNKVIILLLACLLVSDVQAIVIDNFDDGNMNEYVQTVVLETETTQYDSVFSNGTGAIQVDLSAYPGIEQALCLRDDYSLYVGCELRVDITGWVDGGNQDLGLVVAATKNQPEGGPRADYLFICIRNNRNHYLTRQFLGTSEEPYVQNWPGYMDALYIERIDIDTFETGYYIGEYKMTAHTMDVANTNIGNAIGFYSDMRAVGTIGTFDNLEIISTYYVNPGESIQYAIDGASYGDTIYVAAGTYSEWPFLDCITLKNGVALIGAGASVTTIDQQVRSYECDSSTILQDFTITNGEGAHGGGMYNDYYSSPTVTNCIFSNNAGTYGGGMGNYDFSSPTVTNCTFYGNEALYGGGMYNEASSPTVINCTFSENFAVEGGGGMYNATSNPTVTNCTFYDNFAINCGGSGMYNAASSPTVTNCILWDVPPDEIHNDESTYVITYSDISGGSGLPWFGAGCIATSPLFVDEFNGNLRLLPGSPCIDAGNNAAVSAGITTDLDGRDRIVDGDCNDTEIVDMGAYEFLYSDIDSNGSVDFVDFSRFALHWMDTVCGECGGADLTCDGNVNEDDLQEFCDNWLAGTEP